MSAFASTHPCCQKCGKKAEIWDIDGSWCSGECRRTNRREVKR